MLFGGCAVNSFQAPTGTRDILAPESTRFKTLVATFANLAELAGYGLVISPMFEDSSVFHRGVGEASDVVAKEMYEFDDRGGRRLALRPEGTASIARAYVQHRPQLPWKAWYATPAFRYERPQAGRYRQHHQVGIEALGSNDPDLDVEVINLLTHYLTAIGLERMELRVNSMGDSTCRPAYVDALSRYLGANESQLCQEHQRRWKANPMRFLDCKKPDCVDLKSGAPRLSEALCIGCIEHLARVIEGLDAIGIAWRRDETLVRGLDYYTRTTFEVAGLALDSAQDALGGGGRYDGLVSQLGGPATPGIGFASGIERVMLALEAEGNEKNVTQVVKAFVVDMTDGSAARDLTSELRAVGIGADRAFDNRSLKAQMRQADRSGAYLALIVGPDEAASGEVTVKELRQPTDRLDSQGSSIRVKRAEIATYIQELKL